MTVPAITQNPLMKLPALFSGARFRIVLLAGAMLVLALAGVTVLLQKPSPEDILIADVRRSISLFEEQKTEQLMGVLRIPLVVRFGRREEFLSATQARARFDETFAVYRSIEVRPRHMTVEYTEDPAAALVSFEYEWEVRTRQPGQDPFRSWEGRRRRPPSARLLMEKTDEGWKIAEVELEGVQP